MKTTLFRDYDGLTQQNKEAINGLKKDFVFLLKIDKKDITKFTKDYVSLLLERDSVKNKKLKESINERYNLSDHDSERILKLSHFFVGQFLPSGYAKDEKPSDLVDDIIELEIVDKNHTEYLVDYLESLKNNVGNIIEVEYQKLNSARKSCNTLEYISSNPSLRAVFKKEADFGEFKENYSPECIGFVSVADIELKLNGNHKSPIHFTCDKVDINKIIITLQNTLTELIAAEKFANLD